MQAIGHLKAVTNPDACFDKYKAAKAFLSAPPLGGEEVLAQRIAKLAANHPTQPAAQGLGAQLVAFIEKVRDFTAQAVRVGSKGGEIRWDIEFGPNEVEVRGKTLQEAIAKALAAQAKKSNF